MPEETNVTDEVTNTTDDTTQVDISAGEGSNVSDETASEGDTSVDTDDTTIDPVPYKRFQEVTSDNAKLREMNDRISSEIAELRQLVEQKTGADQRIKPQTLDDIIQERVKQGQPLTYEELFQIYDERKRRNDEEEQKRLDEKVENEVKALYKEGLIKTKSDENAVIDFALKRAKEVGLDAIPLRLAARWYNETKQPETSESKEVSKKVQSSKKSDGKPKGSSIDLSKDLDEIIFEAKANAPK